MKNYFTKISLLTAAIGLLSLTATGRAAEGAWLTDYAKAAELAKAGNKSILLDFTGSDWCGWCIRFGKEVLQTKEFKDYAAKNLVLVEVDFPNAKPQTDRVKKQNEELKDKYGINGFPTFVLLDKNEKETGRQEGYLPGGPAAFIAKLGSFAKK